MEITLGQLLQAARKTRGMSLMTAAKESGLSYAWISQIEKGAEPRLADFLNLCSALGTDFYKLIQLAKHGKAVPGFSNAQYRNEKLNSLPLEMANTVWQSAGTLPECSTDTFYLGTIVVNKKSPVQVQLVVTSNPEAMVDEC